MRNWFSRHPVSFMAFYLLFYLSAFHWLEVHIAVPDVLVHCHLDDLIPKHIIVDDIMASINYLNCLAHGVGTADDIDHLGNRRVRLVGELVENQYRIGLVRMERAIKERMSIQEVATLMPHDLINPKPVAAVLKGKVDVLSLIHI